MHYIYSICRDKNTNYSKFSGKWWIDLIFFLNFIITIVLNRGQNDEKQSGRFFDKTKDKLLTIIRNT